MGRKTKSKNNAKRKVEDDEEEEVEKVNFKQIQNKNEVVEEGDDEDDKYDDIDEEEDENDEEGEEEEEEKEEAQSKSNGKGKHSIHPKLARIQAQQKKNKGDIANLANRWKNRQRTLVFSARGISYRARHLMTDLRSLMPHSKKESKMDRKDMIGQVVPEICELRNCNNCVFFEMRKKQDLFMWVGKVPHGPTAKFFVENVHTMDELKLTGNCLKGSRPILNFDSSFDSVPHLKLLKELFIQTFGTPKNHPKSKPFVDHVMSFFWVDDRVWLRNYQIAWEGEAQELAETTLTEIGPRFCLKLIRIFDGCFGGPALYQNQNYITPNEIRSNARKEAAHKYKERAVVKRNRIAREADLELSEDELDTVFH